MIIIEAKSQTGFGGSQNESFDEDPKQILALLDKSEDEFFIDVIGLASSIYLNSNKRNDLPEIFNKKCFSWEEVFLTYSRRQVFLDANECYGK
jgi:hypothetical protein